MYQQQLLVETPLEDAKQQLEGLLLGKELPLIMRPVMLWPKIKVKNTEMMKQVLELL